MKKKLGGDVGCMPVKEEQSKTSSSTARSRSLSEDQQQRRKRSKSTDNKLRSRSITSTASSSSKDSTSHSAQRLSTKEASTEQVPLIQQLKDEPSRGGSSSTDTPQILTFNQKSKLPSSFTGSNTSGTAHLRDIPSRLPPRKTRSGILPSTSTSFSKTRRREIKQQIDDSILLNMQIDDHTRVNQKNETIRQLLTTSSPSPAGTSPATTTSSNSRCSVSRTKSSRSAPNRSSSSKQKRKGSKTAAPLPGMSFPVMTTNDLPSRGRDRRIRRTTSASSGTGSTSLVGSETASSRRSSTSSYGSPDAMSVAAASVAGTVTPSKTIASEYKVDPIKKTKRSKCKDASSCSSSSSKKRSSSVSSNRRRRRKDKGDAMPTKPRKAPPSPTEDDISIQTELQTTKEQHRIENSLSDESKKEKAAVEFVDARTPLSNSRWSSEVTAQPTAPSSAAASQPPVRKRYIDGKTVRSSAIKPKRVSSDPYISSSNVWKGPPPLPLDASDRSQKQSSLSKDGNRDGDTATSEATASRGRNKNVMKSLSRAVRKISRSPGPHHNRRGRTTMTSELEEEEQRNPDSGLPNPQTYKFWEDDRTASTASTRTMSTMSTDHSDQSTLLSSDTMTAGAAATSRYGLVVIDKIETPDGEGIDHLLGRLRSNFDKPSDDVHHKPVQLDSLNKPINHDTNTVFGGSSCYNLNPTSGKERRKRPNSSAARKTSSRPSRNASEPIITAGSGRKRVMFGTVSVREYERCIGDNPAVSSGPPIGLGWYYLRPQPVDLEYYEANVRKPSPRTRKDFFLTPQKRFHILLNDWGFSVQDICQAKDQAAELRLQRQVSVFGDAVIPQIHRGGGVSATTAKQEPATRKSQYYSSSRKTAAKIAKLPRSQDRWNASCPAAPVSA